MESIRLHFLLGKSDRKVDSWRHKIDKSKKRNSGCIEKEERNNKKAQSFPPCLLKTTLQRKQMRRNRKINHDRAGVDNRRD
mgnify:CR=1 FL=1